MLPGKYLHKGFEKMARVGPDRIAVTAMGEQISYGKLDSRANRLAYTLRSLGTGPDVLVGLCVDRGIDMMVGLLAILKAGSAYLPIDPTYPSKRIEFLLADSAVRVVVAASRVSQCLGECNATIVYLDDERAFSETLSVIDLPAVEVSDNSLAYVIYTSGSTGKPKGVLIEHRNIFRVFEQTDPWFHFSEDDIWTIFHSVSFDFSVWEMWGALLYGGRVVIVPNEIARTPVQMHALLRTEMTTIYNQTPSAFRQLIAADMAQPKSADFSLRAVIFGGEELDVKVLEPWFERYGDQYPLLVNMYGITEASTHVTYRPILKNDLSRPDVSPIGVAIPDFQLYTLDSKGDPVEDGVAGELYVAGAGTARGYLNRPELTAQRFVPGPDGTRMYYSADRVVGLPDGELAYLGRSDDQLKVRGFRIEPREIEHCLCGHPEIATALVMAHDYGDGDVRLVAFVIPQAGLELGEQARSALTAELSDRAVAELPMHLRPSAYFVVGQIPMTAHGKIDKDALRELLASRSDSNGNDAEAVTHAETVIAGIWEEVLQRQGIGREDDFFDLGGTSLALLRIMGRVNEHFNVSLDGSVLVDGATINRLACCVDAELAARDSPAGASAEHKRFNGKSSKTATEEVISAIWEEVLQRQEIGMADDFFDLGGTSLALLRIFGRVNEHFNVSLDGSVLVEGATISRLAVCVDAALQDSQSTVAGTGDRLSNRDVSRPRTTTEDVIAGIWEEVLQRKVTETSDDFFDVGGTSLALLRIFGRVNEQFNIHLDGSVLVEGATIARLASCVEAELSSRQSQPAAPVRTERGLNVKAVGSKDSNPRM